jgi:phosphate:Na+ symporter
MEEHHSLFSVTFSFLGSLALFLFGIRTLSSGLKKSAGRKVRTLIAAVTENRFTGLAAGAFATMIVQSSSTVMVTLIGLVQSQLMTYPQSIGVILGAEIGTTAFAQLIAFNPGDFSLVIFAAGFFLNIAGHVSRVKQAGEALAGLGLLFFALRLMTESLSPLRGYEPFLHILKSLENPFLSVLAGMVLTALMQSSAAFIGIIMMLAHEGSISLEAAIPLLLGSNIGTCATAALGSIGALRPAKRVALAQFLFNASGVAVFMFFVPSYAWFIRLISPESSLPGIDKIAFEVPRQIANAHSFYNIFMVLLVLPFSSWYAKLLLLLLPDDPEEMRLVPSVWFLKDSALATPSLALSLARAEVTRMNRIVGRMVYAVLDPFLKPSAGQDVVFSGLSVIGGLKMREEKIDYLEQRVTDYLLRISRGELGESESREAAALMTIVKEQEAAGDVVETLLEKLLERKKEQKIDLTDEGKDDISRLHRQVCVELAALTPALHDMDEQRAAAVLHENDRFGSILNEIETAHMRRVRTIPESETTHTIHMELLKALQQIHHCSMHIASSIPLPNVRKA